MWIGRAATLAIVFLWSLSSGASAAEQERSPDLLRIAFSDAPRPIQRELIDTLADCGAAATLVRSAATFDVGPIGGPGRKDYFFIFSDEYWHGSTTFIHYPPESMCTVNYIWSYFWMDVGGGKYKSFLVPYPWLYFKNSHVLIFKVDLNCEAKGEQAWWDAGRFVIWNPRADAFHPITKCITRPQADALARARGYRRYSYLPPSWAFPLP